MDLSQVKMVVSDMDGTLLNSNHEVSDRFFELFNALKKKNILFVAASGRQYNSIVNKLEAIKDNILVIAENGGLVMHQEKELLATPLDPHTISEALTILEGIEGANPVLCGKNNAYLKPNSDAFIRKLEEYYTEFTLLKDWEEYTGDIIKIAVYHFVGSEAHLYPSLRHFEKELKVKVSGENWLDLSHFNANKGYALQKVQQMHGISAAETMVFGDYNNDLEMMAAADYSFAMANAHPTILQAARYKTHSNDDFGVERVLEKLLEAH